MALRHIERKKDLEILLKRMDNLKGGSNQSEFDYWHKVVEGCIKKGLAMDEVDYENAPSWFRKLWVGLR